MENHIVHKFSRLFPSSFSSCQFRNIPDVVESSIVISTNNNVLGASSRTISSIKTQESKSNKNNLNVSKGSKTHKPNKESNFMKSSSSNSGWFSSEGENEFDGETEGAFFSLSSGYFSESFRRKPPETCRKKYNQKSSEMSRCSSELSVNSMSTALRENRTIERVRSNLDESKWVKSINGLDFTTSETEQNRTKISKTARKPAETCQKKYNEKSSETSRCSSELSMNSVSTALSERKKNERVESNLDESKWVKSINGLDFATSKSEQNRGKISKTARKTAEKQTRCRRTHRKTIPVEKFDYYSEFTTSNTRRKTTKCRRKIKKMSLINSNEMGKFSIVIDGKIEESIAVEKSTSDPYSDFRTSMVEMIVEKQIFGLKDLQRLLHGFLSLNSPSFHKIIFEVFSEICETLFH
ncbi:transcription repressor OFP5-like [Lycium ferocissimum]|uniref:transcription repressor OFP5-like n=1 Tax=Lycium ferocissimum TaxID=112874 RepID=UPI002814B685|nr:transcription repressor OFP5-like [Lycium ferocissimum]